MSTPATLPEAPPAAPRPMALAGLLAVGAAWGVGAPLVRLARLEGYAALQIIAWHTVLGALVLAAVLGFRGRWRLPLDRASLRLYAVVAALGIVLPHFAAFWALAHVPAAVHSVIVSLVPIFALGIALALRIETFHPARALGLALGAAAVAVLVVPQMGLPGSTGGAFVLVSLIAPVCYALEGIFVANLSRSQAGPMQALLGGTLIAAVVVVPAAAISGPLALPPVAGWGGAEWGIVIAGAGGALAYAGYVALLRAGGAVFAAQVGYVVTAAGVIWAMVLLGERPSRWLWLAMALLFAGLMLVRPRRAAAPT